MRPSETLDFEREFEDVVRELRALPTAAPAELRERVRSLGDPAPRRSRLPHLGRRPLLALAGAGVAALVGAAVVHGLLASSPKVMQESAKPAATVHGPDELAPPSGAAESRAPAFGAATGSVPAPNPNRYQDYEAALRLRVSDFDALGRRTADAIAVVRNLGGFVASVDQSTVAGQPGEADLVLRVPVANVETALVRLSALGTVLEQHVSIRDLNAVVAAQRQRIEELRVGIARIESALAQSLPADARLRLEFQLDQMRGQLRQATGASGATLREAALSRIDLSLTTQRAAVVVPHHHRGRAARAVDAAVAFLAGAGAVALAALIVVSPLVVLAALWLVGSRAYRRREERRLLAAS